ncbi:hypothetical protein ACFQY5_34025 [Paeniroseomonas aquatica]
MRLTSETTASQIYHLKRFLEFLIARDKERAGQSASNLKSFNFHVLRDFEHWLMSTTVKSRRLVEKRADLLKKSLQRIRCPNSWGKRQSEFSEDFRSSWCIALLY